MNDEASGADRSSVVLFCAVVPSIVVLAAAAKAGALFELTALLTGLVVATAVFFRPAVGGALLAALGAANAASVLTAFHGVPSLTEPLLIMTALGIAARWWRAGEAPRFPGPDLVLLLSAYAAVLMFSILWSSDRYAASESVTSTVRDMIITFVIVASVRNLADLRLVVVSLIAVGAALGSLVLLQVVRGDYSSNYGGFADASMEQIVGRVDGWRIKGPFDDPNFFAQAMVVLFALSIGCLIARSDGRTRALAAVGTAASGLAVVFSYSRGGMLGLLAVSAAALVFRPPSPRIALLLVVAVLVPASTLPTTYVDRLAASTKGLPVIGGEQPIADSAVRGRTSEAIVGVNMFLDHPLAGVGAANYPYYYQDYSRVVGLDPRREDRKPHSLVLQIASETGLLGLATFGSIVMASLAALRRARRHNATRDLGVSVTLAWIGFLVTSVFLHSSYGRSMWLMIAISLTLGRIAVSSQGDPGPPAIAATEDDRELRSVEA